MGRADIVHILRTRRRFLTGLGVTAMAAVAGMHQRDSRGAEPVPFSSGTRAPAIEVPAGACDCHMHIYDSRFPVAPNAVLRPPDARVGDYRQLQKRLGTARCIVVQPSTYGTDNRCTLDAIAQLGDTARAVAVVDTSVGDDELKRLDKLGVRGIRFNLVQAGATTLDMLEPLSRRVHELGWHVQIHMLADQIVQAQSLLQRLPSVLVIDHLGRIPAASGTRHPAFGVIEGLVQSGRTWIKLSGAYQESKLADYGDLTELGQAYVRMAPERMVWASDWPHPTQKEVKPDDAVLLDLLGVWAPDPGVRRRILVDNPQVLYGFQSA
jgi:predicted TIM-barrel fold metal-dependent hydrolase